MIRLSKACVGREELSEIERVFTETVNFGLGVHVKQFEDDLQAFLGTSAEIICVNSGTAALHIVLEGLRFKKGSEVLVPSITFVASYAAISAAGLVPVSCDVKFPSCHIDPEDAARRVTEKTVAIMPVAYSGTDFDRVAIYDLASKHGLRVLEDDAHAFGGQCRPGVRFGADGDIVCFSFDGIKNITCGEGGAVVTKDRALAERIRVIRSLGIEKDVKLRYEGKRSWDYDVAVQGFRYHMSNINAAIGVAQLRKFEKLSAARQGLVRAYDLEIAARAGGVLLPTQTPRDNACLHIYSILIPDGISRSKLQERLRERGFETGFHYVPNHTHSLYRTPYALPVAERIGKRLLSLPLHPDVPVAKVPEIIAATVAEVAVCSA